MTTPSLHRTAVVLASVILLQGSAAGGTERTRGTGIYPGRASEYSGPTLVSGGQESRNLALGRTARHSSSYDYNLTAQLATDGIISEGDAAWFRLLQD